MDEIAKMESHLSSAAAFVEGGVQDVCDDACSICLEAFSDSDPSTVTNCKHEFHLQCILEWCQRSSQCPMCWRPISLKDSASQELLEAVEKEREIRVRVNQTRSTAIFHHPALGDFELQHLPVGATESELEERIIQHLAAAAAMGRAHHIARREGQRVRSAAHGRPQFVVFSTNSNPPSITSVTASPPRVEDGSAAAVALDARSTLVTPNGEEVSTLTSSQAELVTDISSGSNIGNANRSPLLNNRFFTGQSTPVIQDRAGPSDFQSFSESLKSRLNSVSMRYKDSITKSTRGWKERLFSRNSSIPDIRSEVRREVSAGIASVSRLMERLDTRESGRNVNASNVQTAVVHADSEQSSERVVGDHNSVLPTANTASTFYAATSGSN
ncbi:E3 ubiquitin-protein ligase RHF2A-like [Phalaenopsis equestris]|uniref:E3 ubiquitin-protein ligase RHF2A-like n=1 Tax=Phalaenopsis equestris TaxID=78828 RepID=UPI0009E5D468|nr:E3 ubiquitin-protein ligase RHF2A-like [Phalaenopsis equestris]XP_020574249.1 E3 ubiquitin-protein ligase RHF2A-like [Phalaenopsis equestris]XP_020574250.1 E3 ubiquitin-protein ligase RHF2A-like [Phalaenopsis equestris]XP_020574251.1 E3 ubiquitin-protein ligase RHF2A-like [Phalaenopsis equestris]